MYVEIYVYCTVTFVTLVENFYVKTSFRMTVKRPCDISVKTRHDTSRRATLPTKAPFGPPSSYPGRHPICVVYSSFARYYQVFGTR